jgi:uridylate kinase
MKAVVRVGGSVAASPPDPVIIKKYCDLFKILREEGHELVIVVGGGFLARKFIGIAKKMGLEDTEQDEIAISVSRLYAQLLNMGLGDFGSPKISKSLEDAASWVKKNRIAVMGGLKPQMTTDAVAALIAKKIGANLLLKATDQDGIYTKDPRKHLDAKKIDEISFDALSRFLEEDKHHAGIHQILDPRAVLLLKKEKIRTVVFNGFKPENLVLAMEGKKVGTVIE